MSRTALIACMVLPPCVMGCSDPQGPEAPQRIVRQAGDQQIGHANAPLAPFVVRVVDRQHRPVEGAPISWTVREGEGALEPSSNITDSNGLASAVLVPAAGANRIWATLEGTESVAVFSAFACRDRCEDWTLASRLPRGRAWTEGAAYDGRIWLVGGAVGSGSAATADVLLYDPAVGSWEAGPSLPFPRVHGVLAVLHDRIHYIGGHAGPSPLGDFVAEPSVLTFDPSQGVWKPGAPMAEHRIGAATAVVDGRIHVAGGVNRCDVIDGCSSPLANLEIYDPVADRWMNGAPMRTGRMLAGAAAMDGKLWVAGGMNCANQRNCDPMVTVEEYDPATDQWAERAPLPVPGLTRLVVLNGTLYAYIASDEMWSVFAYDRGRETWTALSSGSARRVGATFAAFGNDLLIIGGEKDQESMSLWDMWSFFEGWFDSQLHETVLGLSR